MTKLTEINQNKVDVDAGASSRMLLCIDSSLIEGSWSFYVVIADLICEQCCWDLLHLLGALQS